MNKKEFMDALYANLSEVSDKELDERISFYSEMIDDLVEEGYSEEEAVRKIGSAKEISEAIASEFPLTKQKTAKGSSEFSAKQLLIASLGSPLWIPLLIAAFAVLLSLFVSMWSVLIAFWAAEVSLLAGAVGSVVCAVVLPFLNKGLAALLFLSCAAICAGLAIFCFYGCKAATRGTVFLTKKFVLLIKMFFVGGNA